MNSPDDVATAWEYAMSGGRVNQARVIVEEIIKFDYEITQLTVRAVGEPERSKPIFAIPSDMSRSRATMSNPGNRSQ